MPFYYQVGVWDTCTGERIKRMKGHTSFVNSVDCSRGSKPLVVSGGDDCQVGAAYKTSMEPLEILKLKLEGQSLGQASSSTVVKPEFNLPGK